MTQNITAIFGKAKMLLDRLSSKPAIGGLEINDSIILFARFKDSNPKTFSVKLPPGTVKEGKILNKEGLLEALINLRKIIGGEDDVVPVVVSLPQNTVFIQSFSVPDIGKDKLKEEAALNLQMISPMPEDKSYSDWQEIGMVEDKRELLGAFTNKELVDTFSEVLNQSGFSPYSFEFPSLSLVRLINASMDAIWGDEPILVLRVSTDGIHIFLLKNKGLFFDYSRSWSSIQGEDKKIPMALFEEVIKDETRKVLNFSMNKFKREIDKVILIAPSFEEKIQSILSEHFSLKVLPFHISQWSLSSNWYPVIGTALREITDSRKKKINISPVRSESFFFMQHLLSFIKLWRTITWIAVGLVFCIMGVTSYLITSQSEARIEQLKVMGTPPPYDEEIANLQRLVGEFNILVSEFQRIRETTHPWNDFLAAVKEVADESNISISRFNVNSPYDNIALQARAAREEAILEFRDKLTESTRFEEVSLRVTDITTLPDRSLSFRIDFRFVNGN